MTYKSHTNPLVKMVHHISVHSTAKGTTEVCARFVAQHINSFWSTDMEQRLVERAAVNSTDLSTISALAVEMISTGKKIT